MKGEEEARVNLLFSPPNPHNNLGHFLVYIFI